MKYSLEEQLILHEGLKLEIYKCPANKWTIGVGRNLEDSGLTETEQRTLFGRSNISKEQVIEELKIRKISETEALYLLRNDIQRITDTLDTTYVWFVYLDPIRRKVCIDMAFNLGLNDFAKFKKMIRALSVKDYQRASLEMKNSTWYHQVGQRSKRLVEMMKTGKDYK